MSGKRRCAYCGKSCSLTREHVIPRWWIDGTPGESDVFSVRQPIRHRKGDLVVRDVCKSCNSGPLSELDGYGKRVWEESLREPVYLGETLSLKCRPDELTRWLLKICYNSGRAQHSDVDLLGRYAGVILNGMTGEAITVFAHVVSPTDFGTDPPSPALRLAAVSEEVRKCNWFRCGKLVRLTPAFTEVVVRQVYVDSVCFTLFIPPAAGDHSADHTALCAAFQRRRPEARQLLAGDERVVELEAAGTHAAMAIADHLENYPTRYDDPELSRSETDPVQFLLANPTAVVAFEVSRREVQECLVREVSDRLRTFTATAEAARAAQGRVAIFFRGWDDDPRELCEVPEVRRLAKKLMEVFPQVAFLAENGSGTLVVLFSCYCFDGPGDIEQVGRGPDGTRPFWMNPKQAGKFYNLAFVGLNETTDRCGMDRKENKRLSEDLFSRIESVMDRPAAR